MDLNMRSSIMEMRPMSQCQENGASWKPISSTVLTATRNKKEDGKQRYIGLLFAVMYGFLNTLQSAIVKKVNVIGTFQVATYRYIGMLLLTVPMFISNVDSPIYEHTFPKGNISLLVFRGAIGSISLMFKYYAYQNMPLADASVIIFSTPIFVLVLARIFLKEMCSTHNIICVILTTGGLVLIAKPAFLFEPTSSDMVSNWKGLLAAITGTSMSAGIYIVLRKVKKSIQTEVVLLYLSAVSAAITGLTTLVADGTRICLPACGQDRLLTVCLGPLGFFAQVFLTLALKREEAGPVAIMISVDVVFAFVWQWLLFDDEISSWSVLGALLVTFSAIVLGVEKWVSGLPEDAPLRKRFGWLKN